MKTSEYKDQWRNAVRDVAFSRGEDFKSAEDHILWATHWVKPVLLGRRVYEWLATCVGPEATADKAERVYRFAEESFELQQACGMTFWESVRLAWYVYRRPVGEIPQEVGGVILTATALCNVHGIIMEHAVDDELDRAWDNIDKIRTKHQTKPRRSPLPGKGQFSIIQRFEEWKQHRRWLFPR